ncbi:MAG: T9SS type A sorting domain-containing protein [Bacteroidota bacterium]
MILSFGLMAQDMEYASADISVNISTQVHDTWELSGNVIVNRTVLKGDGTPSITVHRLETNNEILAEAIENLAAPAVPLGNFTARYESQQVTIDWTSMLPKENSAQAFYVQRSFDGQKWENIGMLRGAQKENVIKAYSFVDNEPTQGSNFYRLKQVKRSGKEDFSDVIAVEVMEEGYHITYLYPSSVVFGANIDFELFRPSTVDVKLFDAQGELVGTIYSDITSIGNHGLELNLDELPKGSYVCQIRVGESLSQRTIVK